jgi:hypothetical protein
MTPMGLFMGPNAGNCQRDLISDLLLYAGALCRDLFRCAVRDTLTGGQTRLSLSVSVSVYGSLRSELLRMDGLRGTHESPLDQPGVHLRPPRLYIGRGPMCVLDELIYSHCSAPFELDST